MERNELMWEKLKKQPLWVNGMIAIFLFLVLLFMVLKMANLFTRHGEKIAVPNLINKSFGVLENEDNPHDFEYVITDSMYLPGKPGGVIIDQDPKPSSFVKNGRKIYISVTSYEVPKLPFPLKEGVSLRLAKSLIENYGFKIGKVIEKPNDMVKSGSFVLESIVGGKKIKYGQLLKKGSVIDIVIAVSVGNDLVPNVDLIGLSIQDAVSLANSRGFQLRINGIIEEDSSVYKVEFQKPDFQTTDQILEGSTIEITVSKNSETPLLNEDGDL